ncbi:molybdenum cofactor guanylyltransferase [Kistimonas scapharcae]|uniref:Molybdenum cofactor guanylyltransferase n=2 Tax=Kistimonas scapharcae TaxID=1036133 RepID=A0ABP8V371_9GAMM
MGCNKAHIAINDQPLWQYMLSLLNETHFREVIISGPEGLPDIIPGKGPISGLHTCLSKIPDNGHTQAVLILPVDMPLITSELLVQLVDQGQSLKTPLHYDNYQLPLYLPITEALRNYTEAVVHEADKRHYSLRRLIAHLHGSTIPVPDDQDWRFRNANTPDEWQHCLADV